MTHTYLNPASSAAFTELELVHERVVLGLGIGVAAELRRVPLDEDPELHHIPQKVRRLESDTLSDGSVRVHPGRATRWPLPLHEFVATAHEATLWDRPAMPH